MTTTLKLSTRIRNHHRIARRAGHTTLGLKPWARKLAETVEPRDKRANPNTLALRGELSEPALAYHWLASR
jgi:hypothetical protein